MNDRQARWALILAEYDINLLHTPGSKMIQSDTLSRRPDHTPIDDENETPAKLLPDNLFISIIDLDLQKRIENTEGMDTQAIEAMKLLVEEGNPDMKRDISDWKLITEKGRKSTLFYKNRQYIPNNLELR